MIAEHWGELKRTAEVGHAYGIVVRTIDLTRSEFMRWVTAQGYRRPTFWGDISDTAQLTTAIDLRILPAPEQEARAAEIPDVPELRRAPAAEIHAAITAVYDRAELENAKPPNVKELPKVVQPLLVDKGYQVSANQIQKLGAAQQHAKRRRKVGRRWRAS
jgi:hypothetical protein